MRFRLVFALVLSSLAARGAEVEFSRVWPQWRDAESFDRISEYFGGRENTGRTVVLRTHADVRAGYYFVVRLAQAPALTAAVFELSLIRADAPEPKNWTFPVATLGHNQMVELGLTGADWPGVQQARPVAWKITLRAADGRVLAEQKSFLWEKPAM